MYSIIDTAANYALELMRKGLPGALLLVLGLWSVGMVFLTMFNIVLGFLPSFFPKSIYEDSLGD